MRPPATPITMPFRKCSRCGAYKPVLAGTRNGTFVEHHQHGARGVPLPFVCLGCNRSAA